MKLYLVVDFAEGIDVDTIPLTKNLWGVEGNVQKMLEAIDELNFLEIAEGQTLDGYSKKLQWVDDNEYITTAGRTITIAIGDTGYKRGKGIIFNATYPDYVWEIIFTTDAGQGLSYGGRASSTFNTIKARSKAFGDTALTDACFTTSPSYTRNYLVSAYIEGSDLKLVFDTATSATLHAKIDVELMKG
ncbi:MAG: hypothetical protein KKH94_11295 [Candidatus Omnitrophica bacterium]|nr:hypothetical protein [Candidatus Omnitrophota bacterium]